MTFDFDDIQVSDRASAHVGPLLGLWAQMVIDAVEDIHFGLKRGWSMTNCPDNSTSNDFRTAYLWLHDWDDGSQGSFSWACGLFEFDPDRVRAKAMTNSCRIEIAQFTKRAPKLRIPNAELLPSVEFTVEDMMPGRARTTVYKMIRDWLTAGVIEQVSSNPKRYRPTCPSTQEETESAETWTS